MNKGFQILIEDELSSDLDNEAIDFANKWVTRVINNDCSWRDQTWGGWKSYLRRGIFGFFISSKKNTFEDLVFRRISKHKRIFGILRAKHLRLLNGNMPNLNQCICYYHMGGQRVFIPNMPKMKIHITYGKING